jgi:hypothetical protein
MLEWLNRLKPACSHKKTSLPITRPRRDGTVNRTTNTYVVCLNCSQKIPYSFTESRTVSERRRTAADAGAAPMRG